MKEKGLGDVAVVAIVLIIVLGVLAGIYMVKEGDLGLGGTGNSAELTFSPNQVSEGDMVTAKLTVTNGESSVMTIQSAEIRVYKNNQLEDSDTISGDELYDEFDSTSVSPESTEIVLSAENPIIEEPGNYKYEISLFTNHGTLQDSTKLTVTD